MEERSPPTVSGAVLRTQIETLAPPSLAESWDNVGWQVGHDGMVVRGILVALDVDQAVVEEAAAEDANLILSHHPLLFRGLKRINPVDYYGQLLRRLLCDEIAVYSAHTNLDAVRDGVNGALADRLDLAAEAPLVPVPGAPEEWGFGAICAAEGWTTAGAARRVASRLGVSPRVTPAVGGPVQHERVALLGGSGAAMIDDALAAGCTLFITGEVKYHEAQDAARRGLAVIEAGHFYSERPVIDRLVERLAPLGVPVRASRCVTSPFANDWTEL